MGSPRAPARSLTEDDQLDEVLRRPEAGDADAFVGAAQLEGG